MLPVKRGDMLIVKWKNGESNFFTVKSINDSFVEYIDSESSNLANPGICVGGLV